MNNFDLKTLREAANLSQSALAKAVGTSQSKISRYEDNPQNIPWAEMLTLCRALGVNPAELLESAGTPSDGLDPGNPYGEFKRDLRLLDEFADAAPQGVDELPEGLPTVQDLKQLAATIGRKPNLGFAGRFDAGKSTLANAILGEDSLPTGYQPATRVVTYIRHIDDRPDWMKESVWMFGQNFNALQWDDEAHCKEHKVVAGNLATLRDYGTHEGVHAEDGDAVYAVVYLAAQALRACNIIDIPGDDNDTDDTERARSNPVPADVMIYVSPFQGFMSGADMLRLGQVIRRLPPWDLLDPEFPTLGNLFVVATHAAPHIKDEEVSSGLDRAAKRTWRSLEESVFQVRADTTKRVLDLATVRTRFFSFYRELPSRRAALDNGVSELLTNALPRAWRARADSEILAFKDRARDQTAETLNAYLELIENLAASERELEDALRREPQRKKELAVARKKVERLLKELRRRSLRSLSESYSQLSDVDGVEAIIRDNFDDRKEAQQYAAGLVFEKLQLQTETKTGLLSEELTKAIEEFLEHYTAAQLSLGAEQTRVNVPFNAQGAFVGGLAGAAGVGALAAWAATLGNLGSYIIAAKVVSLLSALGVSISGGTAAVVSFIAAIGGPATLAIGVVVLGVLAGWALFGASWQRRLAKKIVVTMSKKDVRGQFEQHLNAFWDQSEEAFSAGADEVERQFEAQMHDLKALVTEALEDRAQAEDRVARIKAARDFFGGIPWRRDRPQLR